MFRSILRRLPCFQTKRSLSTSRQAGQEWAPRILTIPNTVKGIDVECFEGATFTYLQLPNELTVLGPRAFKNCKNLKEVWIPDSVTSIGAECFYGCANLNEVRLPSGLTELPARCFYGCSNVQFVTSSKAVTEKIDAV